MDYTTKKTSGAPLSNGEAGQQAAFRQKQSAAMGDLKEKAKNAHDEAIHSERLENDLLRAGESIKTGHRNTVSVSKTSAEKIRERILGSEKTVSESEIQTGRIEKEMEKLPADSGLTQDAAELLGDVRKDVSSHAADVKVIRKTEDVAGEPVSAVKLAKVKDVVADAREYREKRRKQKLGSGEKSADSFSMLQIRGEFAELEKLQRRIALDTDSASESYTKMKDAFAGLIKCLRKSDCRGREYSYYKEYMALRSAVNGYLDSHSGHRFSGKGKRRQMLAADIKNLLNGILDRNDTLRNIMIDEIENSSRKYSKEADAALVSLGKRYLKQYAGNADMLDNVNADPKLLTPDAVRISRILRQEEACSGAIEKKLGRTFRVETGMDKRALILGAEHLFRCSSDGTPASKEDAKILDEAVAFGEAFMSEDRSKRHKYLDNIIERMLKISLDYKDYEPENILKDFGKYREIARLVVNFQNVFESDTYNKAYLERQPKEVAERLRKTADINGGFTYLIGLIPSKYGLNPTGGKFKLADMEKPCRISHMDLYDRICESGEENKLYFNDTGEHHVYDEIAEKVLGGREYVRCEDIRKAISRSKLEDKEEALNEFDDNTMGAVYYTAANKNSSMLRDFAIQYHAYDDRRAETGGKVELRKAQDKQLRQITSEYYTKNTHDSAEKRMLEFYRDNCSWKVHPVSDDIYPLENEKNLKGLAALAAYMYETDRIYESYERIDVIKQKYTSGDQDRLITGMLKPVMKKADGTPANEEEKKKEEWNKKYLDSFADENKTALKECVRDVMKEIEDAPLDGIMDIDHMISNMADTKRLCNIGLRYSNLNTSYPDMFEEIRREDEAAYKSITDRVEVLSAWSAYFTFYVGGMNGLSFNSSNGLMEARAAGDAGTFSATADFYRNELAERAGRAGISIPGLNA